MWLVSDMLSHDIIAYIISYIYMYKHIDIQIWRFDMNEIDTILSFMMYVVSSYRKICVNCSLTLSRIGWPDIRLKLYWNLG